MRGGLHCSQAISGDDISGHAKLSTIEVQIPGPQESHLAETVKNRMNVSAQECTQRHLLVVLYDDDKNAMVSPAKFAI